MLAFRALTEKAVFSAEQAREAGERIGIEWTTSRFDVEQFRMGMDVELEHGTHDPETNVTDDDTNDPPDNPGPDISWQYIVDAAPSVTATTPTNGATDYPLVRTMQT